jgi:hypothetical protein
MKRCEQHLLPVMLAWRYASVNHQAVPNGTDFENWLLGMVMHVSGARRLRRRRALVLRTEPRAASRPFGFDRMARELQNARSNCAILRTIAV